MMKLLNKYKIILGMILICILTLPSCNTALYFDQYAYKESISVKVEALTIMESATEDFDSHRAKIQEIHLSMLKIYEYEKNRPNNSESTKMWALMTDPEKHLYAGFIERWKQKSTLNKTFIYEAKKQINEAFDIIIGFEKRKIK